MASATPQLLPMEEADLEEAVRIEIWGNPEDDMQRVLFERDRTPQAAAKLLERRRRTFLHDKHATFLKVVDPATNGIMAWATWHFCPALSEEEVAKGPVSFEWPLPQWYDSLHHFRYEVMKGRPHYLLGMIVTSPDYRRRGAASLLMQWGIEKADERGVEIYLESSLAGRPLYEKFGLRTLKVFDFDMAQLGHVGIDTHTCMLRPKRGQGK
ncbi:hypothetical protein J7T55_005455 [Diaporthe amygdali]|uniref:uncharacterized protein n=1 Tax=Phomopsis amygdali TaxID=1214568 RepID=UPI0022FE89D3|nr:uncharacterized protein J7T55_005455 [Diaporthe amygdali]KAJ0108912.1 hypothetical protein J7T55_005455 [Diaporthe amygdali]